MPSAATRAKAPPAEPSYAVSREIVEQPLTIAATAQTNTLALIVIAAVLSPLSLQISRGSGNPEVQGRYNSADGGHRGSIGTISGRGGRSAGSRIPHTSPTRASSCRTHQPGSHSPGLNPSFAEPGYA